MTKYGWGIDVGVASLGFAIIELDDGDQPGVPIDGVSIVYPASTGAADRTRYKSMRTQNQRRARRMKTLRGLLIRHLELPADFDTRAPDMKDGIKEDGTERKNNSRIRLRDHGLGGELSALDLAQAIMHIAKNRGQRLTRGLKDEVGGDDKAKVKKANERASMAARANETTAALGNLRRDLGLDGVAHPAQLLAAKVTELGCTRLKKDREGIPVFTRAMARRELEALLAAQERYHIALNEEFRRNFVETLFHEEDPKPPKIGKCRYRVRGADGNIEDRIPRGSDLFQRKRIQEEVNNLRIISATTAAESVLSLEQRNALAEALLAGEDLTAAEVRKRLDLGKGALAARTTLDIAASGRKAAGKLIGHPLAAAMAQAGDLVRWRGLSDDLRERIAHLVRSEDDIEILTAGLLATGMTGEAAQALCDARLPAAYSAAGKTATRMLLGELENDVISNHEAELRAGLKSSDDTAPALDRLPYYGEILGDSCIGASEEENDADEIRFGKIPNPVVHVALNQIGRVANDYLALYGKPHRICVEMARDMNKSAEDREEAEKDANENRKRNERYIETLGAHTRKLTRDDLTRMKLHEMQGGECMYTGKTINMEHLFDGSVEVDHILPRQDTRDDGIANLALGFKEAN